MDELFRLLHPGFSLDHLKLAATRRRFRSADVKTGKYTEDTAPVDRRLVRIIVSGIPRGYRYEEETQ